MTDNDAVFLMVEAGDVAGVRAWLSQGGDPNGPRARFGSLLHYAATCGHVELIRLLLEKGALVDSFDSNGSTPLFNAVGNGFEEVARLLLNNGARLVYTFPLPDAAERDRFFWPNGFEHEEMSVTDCCWHFPTLRMLVSEFGADINRMAPYGEPPLMRFARSNDPLAVKWLLENGALVDQTSMGATALFSAVKSGNLETITLLIDAGANVNQYDCDLCVPLHCAESIEAAALLLDRGANPTLRDVASFPCWTFVRNPEVKRYLESAAAAWQDASP